MSALPITGGFTTAIEAVREAGAEVRSCTFLLDTAENRRRLDAAFAALAAHGGTVEQYNAGARVADDCFCPCCGARSCRFTCPACERS